MVVPRGLRTKFVKRPRYAHMSAQATWQRARSCIFWPRMKHDLDQHIEQCAGCQTFPNPSKKEPMIPHEIPRRPWQKIGTDIATLGNVKLLVTGCYYPNFVIAMKLPERPTTQSIIVRVEYLFFLFGLCDVLMTDADSLFCTGDFKKCVLKWSFRHAVSSAHYHQSHGKAEAAVAIVKRIMRRTGVLQQELDRGIMAYNDTPQEMLGNATPSQIFHSRRTKTELPMNPRWLQPRTECHRNALEARRHHIEIMKRSYDRGANELPRLKPGDAV